MPVLALGQADGHYSTDEQQNSLEGQRLSPGGSTSLRYYDSPVSLLEIARLCCTDNTDFAMQLSNNATSADPVSPRKLVSNANTTISKYLMAAIEPVQGHA
jgi:hypothetical protein